MGPRRGTRLFLSLLVVLSAGCSPKSDSYQRGYEDGRLIIRLGSADDAACAVSYAISGADNMDEYLDGCGDALDEG